MYSGRAYTVDGYSPAEAKLRKPWIPPAVAQAPIVTSRCEAARMAWMRSSVLGRC